MEVRQSIRILSLCGLLGLFSNFHCCPEWRLSKLWPTCGVVYPLSLRLSKDSGQFSASARSVVGILWLP
jgi:hypothetical protein